MTDPSFYARAAQDHQRAVMDAQRAARQAGENQRRLAELTNQAPYAYRRGAVRTGVGLVGRFIGFALVIFAMILKQADPHLFNHLVSSFHRLS